MIAEKLFTLETTQEKVQLAENAWKSKDPIKVASADSVDCHWRIRAKIFSGRKKIIKFLTRKWEKELWCFADNHSQSQATICLK